MNPFPGLRPFREDEDHLFFGRENQIDAMVDKLAATRFLAVVGTSGSGKSSLVNCGLRPALRQGLMARAGTSWRIAQFRPGGDPIAAMAHALASDGVLFNARSTPGLTLAEIVETTLRMSRLGLIDIYEQAALPDGVNLLVVVDQFEELFRYRQVTGDGRAGGRSISEEAAAFVNLLLEVRDHPGCAIFVVLTMRSDFLGDCVQFPGLAEAINAGQYLVPRMTRDERRAAIVGPVGVGGAAMSPVLITRLVNDVGDNPDQLSILQHALNRTWARWENQHGSAGPLDLLHYEAIGTMAHALDLHAEKAYGELTTPRQRQICEKVFKALTDKATDSRGIRRPTRLGTLCALAGATEAEVADVIGVFRKASRSFLMPPAGEPLDADSVIDISHESLMRVWRRLNTWADEEARSARMYRRVADTATLHAAGSASLWRDPDLQLALNWRDQAQPNETWASRYHPGFALAAAFLTKSSNARDAERAEREREANERLERQREKAERDQRDLRRFRLAAGLFLVLTVAAIGAAILAVRAQRTAQVWQNRMTERLHSQLESSDGALVVFALDQLSHGGSVEPLFDGIPLSNARSNDWVASVSQALDQSSETGGPGGEWVQTVRALLAGRMSQARRIAAPPSPADDERFNRRIAIQGGSFLMGSPASDAGPRARWEGGDLDEGPRHQVAVPPFGIQEHEVTNAEYRRFDPRHAPDAPDTLPVVLVTWHDAMAYAAWLGGSLPTEAQWEFTARGTEGRTYPWGEEPPTCDRANFVDCSDAGAPARLLPVSIGRERGRTPAGVYDLAGNVWEWTRDLARLYPVPGETEAPEYSAGLRRVLRGGAFNSPPNDLRAARRGHGLPVYPSINFGFRVAWPTAAPE